MIFTALLLLALPASAARLGPASLFTAPVRGTQVLAFPGVADADRRAMRAFELVAHTLPGEPAFLYDSDGMPEASAKRLLTGDKPVALLLRDVPGHGGPGLAGISAKELAGHLSIEKGRILVRGKLAARLADVAGLAYFDGASLRRDYP